VKKTNHHNNKFHFSIIMAVYNVEAYLEEAINSIINQSIGFKKYIQLILVNDGSIDNSKKICEKFKYLYPENIIFIDKENGGVSSARNAGLDVAEGKYVNFLDPDDKLSTNALEVVYHFFESKGKNIDVVSIPIYWFDQTKGKHLLNYKFKNDRLINILEEYKSIQMSASSSFVRREAIGENRFSEQLKYGEDAEWLNNIILNKCEYGVVKRAKYYYRKRSVNSSATQLSLSDKDYYLKSLHNFSFRLIEMAINKLNFVPKYIQYMIMYDLQWRINNNNLGDTLNQNEAENFTNKLRELLKYIDDEVILSQTHLNSHRKNFLLRIKYNMTYDEFYHQYISPNNAILLHEDKVLEVMSNNRLAVELINIEKNTLLIEGHFNTLFPNDYIQLYVQIDGHYYNAQKINRFYKDINVLGKNLYKTIGFKFKVPLGNMEKNKLDVTFYVKVKETYVAIDLMFSTKSFLSSKPNSYYMKNNFILTYNSEKKVITVEKYRFKTHLLKELMKLKTLFSSNRIGSKKAILVRIIYLIRSYISKRPIWIFMDRVNKADDNAEVLFEYAVRQNDGIKKYFVINKDSEDFKRLKKIGKVIPYGSRKHKMYMLLANKLISSHADEFIINPFGKMKNHYNDLLNFDFIFLQHGITKDDISSWLNKYNKNIRLFITAANKEYESILNGNYDYDEKEVILSGFPRFDKLKNNDKKRILIMPTWRSNLVSKINPKTGDREYNPLFKESVYFKAFNNLLNSKKLLQFAKEKGYKIVFFPHPNIRQQLNDFDIDESIEVAEINSSYRDNFNQSSLLVTDYSSVAFDFAYLKKPVIYFQFESNHLEEGYFDYKKMGFGDVYSDYQSVVNRITEYIEQGCKMEEEFINRVNKFYSFTDTNNSKRVYEAINKIDK